MSTKALAWFEGAYLDALQFAQALNCTLDLRQFAAGNRLDPCDYEELREYLDNHGIA